jgi:hypothetical protein
LVRAFVLQWWTAGILLFIWSVQTAMRAVGAGGAHDPHVMLLGVVEAISAVLFLIPKTMKIGAAGLLATFGIAFSVHAAAGQFRGDPLPTPRWWSSWRFTARSRCRGCGRGLSGRSRAVRLRRP